MSRSSPQASAAMVAATILESGSGGADWKAKCQQIYQEFDPPLVSGSYSSVSSDRQETNRAAREQGEVGEYTNNQSEHMVPNSCCVQGSGRHGPPVSGMGSYTEGTGPSYSVYDDQSVGTEHKFLTDRARDFSNQNAANGSQATLKDWLDQGEKNAEDMLNADLQRKKGEEPRRRIKDKKGRSKKDAAKIAKAAARCLRLEAEERFEKMGAKQNAKLENGFHKAAAPTRSRRGGKGGGTV